MTAATWTEHVEQDGTRVLKRTRGHLTFIVRDRTPRVGTAELLVFHTGIEDGKTPITPDGEHATVETAKNTAEKFIYEDWRDRRIIATNRRIEAHYRDIRELQEELHALNRYPETAQDEPAQPARAS